MQTLTYKGDTRTLREWADELGCGLSTIHNRIKSGWPVEQIVRQPPRKKRPKQSRSDVATGGEAYQGLTEDQRQTMAEFERAASGCWSCRQIENRAGQRL
jgi:hypothetical protein